MEGGWRHKPVQFTKSFIPWRGWEQGTPVFYGGEGLSFYSQSFRSASETEEKEPRNNKHATYATRPGGPGTALGWDAGAFPRIFSSLPTSIQPQH